MPSSLDDPYLTLYSSSFNSASPCTNYIDADDDEGIDNDPVMFLDLPAGTYIAVVSGLDDTEFGSYELSYSSFQAEHIPTMNEWGMVIFTALAGSASIYFLRRKRIKS